MRSAHIIPSCGVSPPEGRDRQPGSGLSRLAEQKISTGIRFQRHTLPGTAGPGRELSRAVEGKDICEFPLREALRPIRSTRWSGKVLQTNKDGPEKCSTISKDGPEKCDNNEKQEAPWKDYY